MSNKKYYTNYDNNNAPLTDSPVDFDTDAETEVENTDAADTESAENEETVVKRESLVGVVSGCTKLNIRRSPSIESEVVCEVPANTVLVIDQDESTNDWYSVFTETGFNGFCMKQYVTISQ